MGTVTADGNNHISGFSYDSSGNALGDGVYSYTWNAESQMKTAAGVTYAYDGDGRRAAKVGSKLYWYGSGGEILAETDAAGNTLNEYVFFGGRRVASVPATGSALYYAEDLLGSSRVIAQSNGTLCYDADFTPFGGERSYTSTCAPNYKFEGKERDAETQNDDFGAREYSWRFGRWLSADWSSVPVPVPYANLTNPQTLNLYAMVADDPESFADLDGHGCGDSNNPGLCDRSQSATNQAELKKDDAKVAADTNQVKAQNSDPTTPPPPPTPDPAGTRTDPALNPSNSNSNPSTASSPADQTQAPMESRGRQGGQGKGERGDTAKPDKPQKGLKQDKDGRWWEWKGHEGKWVPKPPGFNPDTAKKVGIGAAIVGGAVVTGHAIAGCFASGACELGLAAAF